MSEEIDRRTFKLLPSEEVLWSGRPERVSRDRKWLFGALGLLGLACVSGLFAGLLAIADMENVRETVLVSLYLAATALGVMIAPRFLEDASEFVLTDRRVVWRRGSLRRSIELRGITFARIRWHASVAAIGDLELVRAVPFGPFARKQRLVLHRVRAPDAVLAMVRGATTSPNHGDSAIPMIERLDEGERVLWGGHPEGVLLGHRELLNAGIGLGVLALGLRYGYAAFGILLGLEDIGLQVNSAAWVLLFFAVALSFSAITGVGAFLVWYGLFRARALGRDTEYVLTSRRLLIRRGRTELSLDRRRIVDVADSPGFRGVHHLFLVLDAPQSRALADSGALGTLPPPRDSVPPVLYDLREVEPLKRLLLDRDSQPSLPPVRDAA